MIKIDPKTLTKKERYRLMISSIIPRPIALVTTVNSKGIVNAAPFSYFNGVSSTPPLISLSVGYRKGEPKDTGHNIRENGEFVINVVSEPIARKMIITATDYPPEISEVREADLELIPSELIAPPRILESPIQMECRLYKIIEIGEGPNDLILGEILLVHIHPEVKIDGNYHIDPLSINIIGRMGGAQYCNTTNIFEMERQKYKVDGK